jgi:hypothetical protein
LVMRHGIRVEHGSRSIGWRQAFVPVHTLGSQGPTRLNVVPTGAAW